jgi:hypothetical protein
MRPQPFRARFIPSNETIKKVVEKEAMEAEARLSRWEGETKVKVEDFF